MARVLRRLGQHQVHLAPAHAVGEGLAQVEQGAHRVLSEERLAALFLVELGEAEVGPGHRDEAE